MNITHLNSNDILSEAVIRDDTIYLCGVTAGDKSADIKGQTEQALATIDNRLEQCGSDKSKILMATIYLADVSQKPLMNEAWVAWLGSLERPARACVGINFHGKQTLVEFVITAFR